MWDLQFDLLDLNDYLLRLKAPRGEELILDFPQPSADYLSFRNHFQKNSVCLENCSLQERTVRTVRRWRTWALRRRFRSGSLLTPGRATTYVDCAYMKEMCARWLGEWHLLVCHWNLPSVIPTRRKLSSVSPTMLARAGLLGQQRGSELQNRPCTVETRWGADTDGQPGLCLPPGTTCQGELESTVFGSPRLASGLFPEWQSWGRMENLASYRWMKQPGDQSWPYSPWY